MYIHVKAKTCQKKEKISKKDDAHFEVSVREKAVRNMANKRIIEVVAFFHKVPLNKVKIINGHRSPSKILSVDLD